MDVLFGQVADRWLQSAVSLVTMGDLIVFLHVLLPPSELWHKSLQPHPVRCSLSLRPLLLLSSELEMKHIKMKAVWSYTTAVCLRNVLSRIENELLWWSNRPDYLRLVFGRYLVGLFATVIVGLVFFMFEFPCIITLYYIKNQQDATLAVLFINHCKITLNVSDAFCFRNM